MLGKKYGGRKKGTPNKKTLARLATVQKALAEGLTPLQVLVETMEHYYAKWKQPPEGQDALETIKSAALAIEAAQMAAPYVHAKPQVIPGAHGNPVQVDEATMLEKVRTIAFAFEVAKRAHQAQHLPLLLPAPVKRNGAA